jgi:MFS transporter, DHA2 family, multidrug resistance protein
LSNNEFPLFRPEKSNGSMKEFDGLPVPRRYWSAFTIWLGLTMSVLDSAIANVALPTIARDLSTAPAESIWVVNAYQLTIVVSLLPLAALGELIGYRRVFQGGLLLFTLASMACTFSHSLLTLAIMRAIQGFGAGGIMSVNGALVRFTYPRQILGRGVGLNALVASLAAALGPTVAAGVLSVGPWEWLFAINIPIGVVAFIVGRTSLPDNPTSGRLDHVSALLNVLTFGLVFTGVDILTRGGAAWLGTADLTAGIVAGALLVSRSRAQSRPLVPLDLLKNTVFALSVVTSIASFTAQMLAFVSLPFYFQHILHWTQVETGLLMTPWPVAVGIGAAFAGRLSDRYSAPILSGVGLVVLALGLVSLAFMSPEATASGIAWRLAVCGLGFGFFQSPNNRTMLASAPLERSGAAAGMLAMARLTGQSTGATLAAISFRLATHTATVALTMAALFAATAALASFSKLLHSSSVHSRKPEPVTRAP